VIVTNPNDFDQDPLLRALEAFLTATDRPGELSAQVRRRVMYLYSTGQLTLPMIESAGLTVRRAAGQLEWQTVVRLAAEMTPNERGDL
jgi:hypothetical protein